MIHFNSRQEELYFNWLTNLVRAKRSYSLLMEQLYTTTFYAVIDLDENRIARAVDLQETYIYENGLSEETMEYLHGTEDMSVLEVLASIAYRVEESIMCDDDYGDRTYLWFWKMIENLDICLPNSKYNEDYVSWVLHRFMNREFEPDGTGSIVKLRDKHKTDARDIEFWHLFCLYLSELSERGEI